MADNLACGSAGAGTHSYPGATKAHTAKHQQARDQDAQQKVRTIGDIGYAGSARRKKEGERSDGQREGYNGILSTNLEQVCMVELIL